MATRSGIVIRLAVAGAIVLASAGIGAATAAADDTLVYTLNTTSGIGRQSPVVRSSPNRVDLTLPSGTKGAYGIAARGEHLYWIQTRDFTGNTGQFSIARYNMRTKRLQPDLVQNITQNAANYPSVAVSARNIFWTEFGGDRCAIGRSDLDGRAVDHSYIKGAACRGGLAARAEPSSRSGYTDLFYVSSVGRETNIARAAISDSYGGPGYLTFPDELVGASSEPVRGLAVNSKHLFWVNHGAFSSSIGRVARSGPRGRRPSSGEANFITGASPYAQGLAASEHRLQWTNWGPFNATIGAASLDSGTVNHNSIKTGGADPGGVAIAKPTCVPPTLVSDCDPPQTTITNGPDVRVAKDSVRKRPKRKAKFRFTSDEPSSSFECRLDDGRFEWCASPFRKRVRKHKGHRLEVRAIDAGGNVDRSAAKQRFRLGR